MLIIIIIIFLSFKTTFIKSYKDSFITTIIIIIIFILIITIKIPIFNLNITTFRVDKVTYKVILFILLTTKVTLSYNNIPISIIITLTLGINKSIKTYLLINNKPI